MASDLKVIYLADTQELAEQALTVFEEKWESKFPRIAKSWRDKWEHLTIFFAYPKNIRKAVRQRKIFPNDKSVTKVIYLAMEKIAMNRFEIMFPGRLRN